MKAQTVDLQGFEQVPFVWLPFIDFAGDIDKRWQHMKGVLEGVLKSYKNPKILDIASGGGHDTIYLLEKGYDVTSNEVDPAFAHYLKEKIKAAGVNPRVLSIDWRDFLTSSELQDGEYDVLFALGNSFPNYLFKEEERERSLKGFWRILKPGGTFFFDTRNYDYILKEAIEILKDPEHNYKYSYDNTYTNNKITGFPVEISPEKVRLQYKHYTRSRATYLDLCPATISSVKSLIERTLKDAELTIYYDYQSTKPEHWDFVQYVLKKKL